MKAWVSLAAAAASAWTAPVAAELRLPRFFSDGAVLQRDRPIHLWGWATPGAAVTVGLHGARESAPADRLGRWDVWLPPESAGGPYTLSISGDGATRDLRDVMLGDVWFASGQSNMEMPLAGFPPTAHIKDSAKEIAAATNPRIRLLRLEHKASAVPLEDVDADWTACTPETATKFSAIGYFFAREIAAREHVTVGVIDSTWGGTPADSWVSTAAIADPALQPALAARARFEAENADPDARLAAEAREDAAAAARGAPKPVHPWHPPEEAYRPSALFNAMVAPFTGYGLKGFLWYQGETNSNVARAPFYEALFKGLIVDWRRQFGQGPLPFLFAQISSFNSPAESWGLVRDAQRRALDLADTGLVVTTDVGDPGNVHPADKQTVAARLALAARGLVYGERVAWQPPLFRQATGTPGGLRVWFDHGEGLSAHGGPVAGFEIAGEDRRFVPATARIENDTVVASAPVPEPRFVRYHWSNVAEGGLYNAAGLPAPTFTSEPRVEGHIVFP
jgi:sialate O-acetylesterase